MKKYDAVIFDLDNTLYSYDRAHAAAFAAVKALAGRELALTPERFDALHTRANEVLAQRCGGGSAIHNRLIRYQIMLELLDRPIALAPDLARCYWTTFLKALESTPGVREALIRLKEAGMRIGVGTNMTADLQFEKLRLLGLERIVDFLVTSEEAGAEKPDRRLFELCAQKARTVPERCVFVGDSLSNDAAAAQAAGMQGVWYCPAGGLPAPDGVLTVDSVSALPDLLISSERRTTV